MNNKNKLRNAAQGAKNTNNKIINISPENTENIEKEILKKEERVLDLGREEYILKKTYKGFEGVRYYFDDITIIGVFDDYVFLKGFYENEDTNIGDPAQECIIKISIKLFKKSWDYCLKDTNELCEEFEMYCEAWGSISSCDINEIVEDDLKPLGLKIYKVNSINCFTDMQVCTYNKYISNVLERRTA